MRSGRLERLALHKYFSDRHIGFVINSFKSAVFLIVGQCGCLIARIRWMVLGVERRKISILFCKLLRSSHIIERLPVSGQ
jgi:hypothetical protein